MKEEWIKRNRKILLIINIVLVAYIFTLSIGYALLSDSLTVNGVATTVDVYEGATLPIDLVVLDTKNNRYYLQTGDSKKHLDFKRETWQGDSYTVYYRKAFGMVASGKVTQTFTIAFTNPTALDFTNGKITTWEVQDDISSSLENLSGSISTTNVKPGERCEV